MRYLFLPALLLATITLHAQNFQLGVNGGFGFNTRSMIDVLPDFISPEDIHSIKGSGKTPAFSVKAIYTHCHWQYGIAVDLMELSYRYSFSAPPSPSGGVWIEGYGGEGKVPIASPAMPIKLLVNRLWKYRHFESYAGLSVGYVLISPGFTSGEGENRRYGAVIPHLGEGFTAGAQVGTTYFVSRCFGFNLDFAANYMSLHARANYQLFAFPATLGIRFKL